MLRNNVPMKAVPRVELDHRVREARLRQERVERLLMPRRAARQFWRRWFVAICSRRIYPQAPRKGQTGGSLSHQRPPYLGSPCIAG